MQQKLLFILIITSTCFYAQRKNNFQGKIFDASKALKNVHVVNLQNKKGTFSNKAGFFKIIAKNKDSLQITAVGFKTKIIIVKPYHLRETENIIILENNVVTLDEIVLKKHNLSGFLSVDITNVKQTYKEKATATLEKQLKSMDPYLISKMGIGSDEIHLAKANKVRLPNNKFEGAGFKRRLGKKSAINKKEQAKKLAEKENFPDVLLSEFGAHFFFKELKIPKEKYNHFIYYCEVKNIFKLYKQHKKFKLIQILIKESKSYIKATTNK